MSKKPSKKSPVGKHPGGRPSKFPLINMKQVKALYIDGKTDQQVADFFDINVDSLYEWKKKHPKFSESQKDWKSKADEPVEISLNKRARGFIGPDEKYYPPDPTSMIFWLKNRKPTEWRDKVDVEHSGDLILNYGHRKQKPS